MQSFTSTKANGIYGPTTTINITANYSENLAVGSTVTAVLNTGASVTLNTITGNTTLTGTYTVGATGSGQNTNDLTVTSISSQNSCDGAANCQIGTIIPSTNIANGSDIIIDTTAPTAPSTVSFISNPINNGNVITAILRVDGEAGSTIYYSINDTDGGTSAVSGNLSMEGDGSTNISNLNFSGLTDGILTATVYLRDPVGNNSGNSTNTVIKDTTNPTFTIQYYSDAGLITSLGNNPRLKAGIYYLKITAGETLNATPTISLDAQGSANDIANAGMTLVSGNDYSYTRTITSDALATGTILETITITGTDSHGNTITNTPPTNTGTKASYTDTIKPTVSGVVTPSNANARTVSINLTFNENENQTIAPTVLLRKQDNTTLSVTGSYINATTWTGTATVSGSDANGATKLEVSIATDLAGNIMDANTDVATFTIDTVNPSLTINSGVDVGPTKNDTIDITTNDNGSGIASQFYGYSANNICDINDTIATAFTSGTNFTITGDHTDYLCTKAIDNAGNIGYQLIGQLNTDNTAPRINSISSTKANGSYKAGEVIDINLTFSENVTSVGNVTVTLETGTIDRNCTFQVTNSNTASCNYTVQTGDTSADLATNSIAGIINDQASNAMSTFTPITTLATNKNLIIDTTSAVVNIISPLNGNSVNGATLILFSDGESTTPQCSFDNTNWIACNSGVTTLGNLTNWTGLADGSFTLYLRDTDVAGNIGTDNETGILKDTAAPRVQNISSNHADGHFKVGEIIDINLTFSRNVTSTGNITVTLETGAIDRSCTFQVTNSNTGACNYTVQAGDTSADLTVYAISGIIKDQVNNAMTNYTPITNLAANKNIVIDTTLPTITSISSNHSDGIFNEGETIDINVAFSEIVTSSSYITVTLDSGGSCTFTATNSNTGTCNYIVATGQNSTDLNVTSISGTIGDQANNSMINFVPLTNLAANKNIVIDTTTQGSPTIFNITSTKINGAYKEGTTIPINVTFSENVTSAGNVIVTLETGTTDRSCTFQVTNSNVGSCDYTVQAGDASTDLDTLSISGTINDQASNPMLNFTPATTLASNKNIIIDTALPTVPIITLLDPITDANKNVATITGTGEANATLNYSIDDTNGNTATKVGTGTVNGSGNINLTNINLTGLDGGTLTATAYLTDTAGNVGPNGTDTATSTIVLPTIASISSTKADGSYKIGESIDINVTFSENVTSTGNVTVTLETGTTDRSCTFQVTNSNVGSCDYTVQAGDASTDLDTLSISGTINDQASNPMLNFTPATTLASNKNIIIDTALPTVPIITLLDPITDANKNVATITGTGEANATLNYSIDDTNGNTATKVGTGTVNGSGNINLTNINLTGLDGGTLTATAYLTDAAGNVGPNGTDTATSTIVLPTIASISSTKADGSYTIGETIPINVTFSESVTSTGNVTVTLETGTTDHSCTFQVTNSNTGSCDYTVEDGDASTDLNVNSVAGTIADMSGNPMLNFTPATNLATNKNIIIDTSSLILVSFTSTAADGTYGPLAPINITATYSANLNVGSSITLNLSTGATATLNTVSGNKLIGTYTVGVAGSDEGTNDLSVSQITAHNSCDIAHNCTNGTNLPLTNISDGSNIAIDAVSPVFSAILPYSSSNIDNLNSNSDISYTLSETLTSGSIVIIQTAREEDSNSPHLCTLTGTNLQVGAHTNFDTSACAEGEITLVNGAIYSFSFNGEDSYGNIADEVLKTGVSFGLDIISPTISNVLITNITSSSAVVSWETNENANSLVDYGLSTVYGETVGDANNSTMIHSVEITNLLSGTTYSLRVRSADSSNNVRIEDNNGVGYSFATLAMPNISNINVTDLTHDSAIVNWNTSAETFGYVEYGTTSSYGRILGNEDELLSDHTIAITGLFSQTLYHYRVRIKDSFGNYSVSGDETFETLIDTEDVTPPVITAVSATNVTSKRATITWTTDELTNSYVEYGITELYGEKYGNDILTTNHSVILPASLTEKTTYHFRVSSSDSAKNKTTSIDYTFTTIDKAINTDLETGNNFSNISGIKLSSITSSSAIASWKTAQVCNGIVRYGLDTKYGYSAAEDATIGSYATFATAHEVTVTNLLSNSKYNYQIISYDAEGNISISQNMTFSTSALSSISKVTVNDITLTSATIIWETGDPTTSEVEYGLSSNYGQIQKNAVLSNFHKVELKDLATGQNYHFRIKGKIDNSNLISSDDYVFATYPKPEVQKYELKKVTDSEATISWDTNIPTESTIEYININNPEDKGTQGLATTANKHELTVSGLDQGSEYEIKIKGTDVNKNTFESKPFKIKTDMDVAPPVITHVNTESSLVNKKDAQVQSIIFWKTDEPATSQVFFDVGMNKSNDYTKSSKEDSNLTTNHLVVLPDLKPGLVYRFKVVSKDKNSNEQNSDTYSLLTPRKDQSVIQLIIGNFEQTFGWMKKIKM